ncbi:MAG: hypothetical protein JWO72_2827 [Caulobacteraceae bacterium]|jgi:hypothetical protein|nr:hypothetical protein [Caulobacteraceae bacterium]
MILIAATIALFTAPAPAAKPDLAGYLAGKDKVAIQEDVRQVAKTECQAEADGPQLALVLACARAAPQSVRADARTASAR